MMMIVPTLLLLVVVVVEAFAPQRNILQRGSLTLQESFSDDSADEPAGVEDSPTKKKYVVVGGGWGGWGAAKALCER